MALARRRRSPSPPAPTDAPVQLPPISVQGRPQGYQTSVPALSKLTQPLVDTPQSITVIPQQLMEDQGVTATRRAAQCSGHQPGRGRGRRSGRQSHAAGLQRAQRLLPRRHERLRQLLPRSVHLNEIEVLKGPASILFGRGSTGGVINQVSKQPQLAPITAGRDDRHRSDVRSPPISTGPSRAC